MESASAWCRVSPAPSKYEAAQAATKTPQTVKNMGLLEK